MLRYLTLFTLTLAAGAADPASGEIIELKSGEKLDVEIIEKRDDKLVVEHRLFGRLEIPRDEIEPPEKEREVAGLFGSPSCAAGSACSDSDSRARRETRKTRM